jgi:hypothetical protein
VIYFATLAPEIFLSGASFTLDDSTGMTSEGYKQRDKELAKDFP